MRHPSLALLLLATAATAAAAQTTKVALTPASSVWVEGSSNVHEWKAASSTLTATIAMAAPADAGSLVESVTLSLPVTSLKSGKGGLDKNLYKALHAEDHSTISYRMTSYEATPENGEYTALVRGLLTVNGVEKEVTAKATLTGDAKQGLHVVGMSSFLMTDFGVKPVTALFGTIRTKNEVTVKFDLVGKAAEAIAQLQ